MSKTTTIVRIEKLEKEVEELKSELRKIKEQLKVAMKYTKTSVKEECKTEVVDKNDFF
jgi:predicted ATP-grasp superfamily ATP-dependent carboligase